MNRRLWTQYDWQDAGEEWSNNWGGTDNLWYGTLMPRIGPLLGPIRVVELGPGYGRLTAYLKNHCSSLVLVDIASNCIEFCRRRFAKDTHLEYFMNDGRSLPFVADATIDFIFSFDSLVHADLSVMTAYLTEIERVLRPGGRAVLHHSNLAAVLETQSKGNNHLRARDVSAERVRVMAARLKTLECRTQELVSWDKSSRLIDCISSFVRSPHRAEAPTELFTNPEFYQRARELGRISERYR
jgi:SAM-dependent methyltransferase